MIEKFPPGLKVGGRRLWTAITERCELERHEADLLERACRTLDQLNALDLAVRRDGITVHGRVHPALVEMRQQNLVFARLLQSLRLPDDEDARPQRRGAVRGVYQVGRRRALEILSRQEGME